MPRPFLACLVAIAFLFTGSMALIAWVTREVPSEPDRPHPRFAETEAAPMRRPAAAVAGAVAEATTDLLEDLGVVSIPPPAPPPPDVSLAPPGDARPAVTSRAPAPMSSSRRKALKGVRRDLKAGLAQLQERVAGCSVADASFSLAVESTEGGVRIVNAFPESSAAADDPGIACVQSALRGQLIPSGSIPPGRHWRMPFAVRSSS